MCIKSAVLWANSASPDQTPRSAASDLGLHCLFRLVCPNSYEKYGRTITVDRVQKEKLVLGLACFLNCVLYGFRQTRSRGTVFPYKIAYAPSDDSGQTVHLCSLMRVFAGHCAQPRIKASSAGQ